jgi:hypothetical protein
MRRVACSRRVRRNDTSSERCVIRVQKMAAKMSQTNARKTVKANMREG